MAATGFPVPELDTKPRDNHIPLQGIMGQTVPQLPNQAPPSAETPPRNETVPDKETTGGTLQPAAHVGCPGSYDKPDLVEVEASDEVIWADGRKSVDDLDAQRVFQPPTLATLPGDVLGIILGHCSTVNDAQNLSRVHPNIKETYVEHQFSILISIVSRQYDPCEELYELVGLLKHGVVSGPAAIYIDTPMNVFYQKAPSWEQVTLSRAQRPSRRHTVSVILDQLDLRLLVHVCQTIARWADIFPQLRFRKGPAHIRRCLRPGEKRRLSRALVRWWRYSLQFHGKLGWHLSVPWDSFADGVEFESDSQQDLEIDSEDEEGLEVGHGADLNSYSMTPGSFHTEPLSISDSSSTSLSQTSFDSEESLEALLSRNHESLYSDYSEHVPTFEPDGPDRSTGRAFMRMLPTMHLVELRDLFGCVYDMVALDLCPSYEHTVEAMGESFHPNHASLSWGRQKQNFVITNTYLKLPPDDLLALWMTKSDSPFLYKQTRARVREKALAMLPGLGLTRQTLGTSLDYVLRERSVLDLWDRSVATEVSFRFDIELNGWKCWGPPTARLRYAGILDLAGEVGQRGIEEYDDIEKRYSYDEIRTGEKPDCGGFAIEDACWDPPTAGWTVGLRRGRGASVLMKLKGDDGGFISWREFVDMEDSGFDTAW